MLHISVHDISVHVTSRKNGNDVTYKRFAQVNNVNAPRLKS